MGQVELNSSTLFVALTKPPMIWGVTLNYVSVSSMIAVCLFIALSNPLYIAVYVPLHLVGWFACRLDPNIFGIVFKNALVAYNPNKKQWGVKSYEPY